VNIVDFRQLKYFLAVAEEGQITKAAKRLNVTQPPLSQQLILLEKELGIQLFERGKKHIRLTEAGHILRNRAEQMMELMKTVENELQETTNGISGRLSIGTITSSGNSLLPERIQKFHQCYPKVSFHVRQVETVKILELLDAGVIEIGIVRFPVDSARYDYILLPAEPMVVAASAHIFQFTAATLELSQLIDHPLLIHQRHQFMISEHCRQAGFEPRILCTSNDITPLLIWANLGIGIAIVPASAINLLPGSSLAFHEIANPLLRTTSAVIWLRKRSLSVAAAHFIALFR
jgi:DNA-binding transcriptional LysR family regulator